jgi:hypothetical protein
LYKEHPTFVTPDDEDIKIWRYMSFAKFISLLDKQSLWFARADKFSDPLEGSYPKMNIEARKNLPEMPDDYLPYVDKILAGMAEAKSSWPKYVGINCWHINETESTAMWDLYTLGQEGIAIQSTFTRLLNSFSGVSQDVYIGKVQYIDYAHQVIENPNLYSPFVYKRKNFEHERELRAIIMNPPPLGGKGYDFTVSTMDNGEYVPVDIDTLIEHVYIAPNARTWFIKLFESILTLYGREYTPQISTIYTTKPLY